ncbi:hypothetical protein T484DRAFT_1780460 [Baffinella frigidus]|nr:hypothetical protein T484DRAFT_1780460 [Cryptophyta sp. CCMP2293]
MQVLRINDMAVLRINDMAVAGLDTRNALDSQYAKVGLLPAASQLAQRIKSELPLHLIPVSLLPAGSQLAQRIKSEGLMSFTTQVEVSMAKDMTSPDPKYDIILSNFDPAMFAGAYIVGVFLGRYQVGEEFALDIVGEEFALEIVEGPADAKRSDLVHDGAWTAVAGQPLDFKLVCRDSAGNAKFKGGDKVWIADATVRDLGNGQYAVSWSNTLVGLKAMNITVNGEPMVPTPNPKP